MRVGFVGAGRMGGPMIERLRAAGHDVLVHRRAHVSAADSSTVDASVRADASVRTEPAQVALDADAVVVCVLTDRQVEQVCLGDGLVAAMRPGSVLVVHTTAGPGTIARIVAHAGPDVAVLDAPVSGGPHDIRAGRITVFAGGERRALDRAGPVLAAYADPVLPVGPSGSGQLVKLLNNTVFTANIGVLAVVARLAVELGLDESAVLSGIGYGSGDSRALAGARAHQGVAAFAASVGEFLGKDIEVVRAILAEMNRDAGLLEPLLELVTERAAAGSRSQPVPGPQPAAG